MESHLSFLEITFFAKYTRYLFCWPFKNVISWSFVWRQIMAIKKSVKKFFRKFPKISVIKTNSFDWDLLTFGILIHVYSWKQNCLFWLLRFYDKLFDVLFDATNWRLTKLQLKAPKFDVQTPKFEIKWSVQSSNIVLSIPFFKSGQ